ncbi:lithostathine-1-alpha-like [Nerophis ophidion]|uniref:lithostathine-1-alpha-like n=1 Tax=Nerophis ophidion TaxID=159077 RepID=UPI002ADF38A1|nr:lithostathine-1-alpha-like [Nerophis ophidion]
MMFSLSVLVLLCGIGGTLTAIVPLSHHRERVCCPEGWTQKDDNCYMYKAEPRTFIDAERVCNLVGGNLASISNILENAVVFQLVAKAGGDEAWIGLHDAVKSEEYLWTDGTKFVFSNFASSVASGGDSCVVIKASGSQGEWGGEPCDDDEPYVCIRPAKCQIH